MGVPNLLRYLRIKRVRQNGLTRRRYAKNNIVSLVLGRGRPVTAAAGRQYVRTFSCTRYLCTWRPSERSQRKREKNDENGQKIICTPNTLVLSYLGIRCTTSVDWSPCSCLCGPLRRAFSNVRNTYTTTRHNHTIAPVMHDCWRRITRSARRCTSNDA